MSIRLALGFSITEDEEADWSRFEFALESWYKISIPGTSFDIWDPNYADFLLDELSTRFEEGHKLAAWRGLLIAGHYGKPVPTWILHHFSSSLHEYLNSRSLDSFLGANSGDNRSQAQQLQADYFRARRYAALVVAEFHGNIGDQRAFVAQRILRAQSLGQRGTGIDSLKQSWTKLSKSLYHRDESIEFGLITSVEFLEMLYYAWVMHRRLAEKVGLT